MRWTGGVIALLAVEWERDTLSCRRSETRGNQASNAGRPDWKKFRLRLVGKASSRRFYVLPNTLGEEVVSWWAAEEPRPLLKCTSGTGAEASEEEPCLICGWNNTQITGGFALAPFNMSWLWPLTSDLNHVFSLHHIILSPSPQNGVDCLPITVSKDNSKGRFGWTLVCQKKKFWLFLKNSFSGIVEAISQIVWLILEPKIFSCIKVLEPEPKPVKLLFIASSV